MSSAARWVVFSSMTVCCFHAGLLRFPGARPLPLAASERAVAGVLCLAFSSSARRPENLRLGIFLDLLRYCPIRFPCSATTLVRERANRNAGSRGVLEGFQTWNLPVEDRNSSTFKFL